MPDDDPHRPVVEPSPGGHKRLQAETNTAFNPTMFDDDQQSLPSPPDSFKSSTADMLPPLTMEEFKSLEELDPCWLTWEETPIDVKTFYRTYDLPQVVKVDDGDYSNFGMGTRVDVARPFLLYTSRRCSKVLVANIYWDDSRQQYVEVGPRVVIPVNYPGWFYFLQDSGAVGKTLKSVEEVVAVHPKAFLVRSTVPCYRRADGGGGTKPSKNITMRVYVRDQLSEGDVLNFDAIHSECVEQTKPSCCLCWAFGKKTTTFVTEEQYLRCTDLEGQEVLLDLRLEGEFSPVGEQGSNSENCVYQLADVVSTSDLPIHMKLCCGQPPSSPCSFTGLLRLEDVYLEETVIACTLGAQRHFMVEFPTDSEIKFIMATDAYRYFDHPVIQKSMEECDKQIDGYVNSIKVVQSFYPDHIKLKAAGVKEGGKNVRSLPPLPTHPDGSQNESMDTTDDYTDDSDFSDYTEDEDNLSRDQIIDNSKATNTVTARAVTIKLTDEPVIAYDDNYEEIPGNRTEPKPKPRPAPPPIPILVQTPITIPPPPPMFDETFDDTYDTADNVPISLPPLVHASYSRAKLERSQSHTETVPVNGNEDIIAPPQLWSDAEPIVPKVTQHSKLKSSVSDSIKMFNDRADTNNADNATVGSPLGRELRERLDAFLTDSVHELHRLQANGDIQPDPETSMSTVSEDYNYRLSKAPKIAPKPKLGISKPPQPLQSHEDMHAFLENIFNADSMTSEIDQMKQGTKPMLRSGTLPHPRGQIMRPVSVDTSAYHAKDDLYQNKSQHRASMAVMDGVHATIRRHNVKTLSIVQPSPANRPNHLPVYHNGATTAAKIPAHNNHRTDNTFIPIRRPNSVSPPQDYSAGSSGEYPPDPASSPERDLIPNRADSGIFVSPRFSDFHLDLESPYGAPSEDPSWTPPADLSLLSVTEIAHCLRYIGMKDAVVYRFVEEQIDGTLLLELDTTLLKEGFPELNALERKKVIDFVGGWRPKKL